VRMRLPLVTLAVQAIFRLTNRNKTEYELFIHSARTLVSYARKAIVAVPLLGLEAG
jgi:hypothetical protein